MGAWAAVLAGLLLMVAAMALGTAGAAGADAGLPNLNAEGAVPATARHEAGTDTATARRDAGTDTDTGPSQAARGPRSAPGAAAIERAAPRLSESRQPAEYGADLVDRAPGSAQGPRSAAGTRPALTPKEVVNSPKVVGRASVPATSRQGKAPAAAPALVGVNHFWFPAIGISSRIQTFACGGSYVIPAGVWHFGCHGPRNIYLMSHAWSDFASVRIAYHRGALAPGMTAYYAGANGKVVRYKVAWVRRVTLAKFNSSYWLWAINDVPAVTLQTCDGAQSQYRIIVRLVRG